MERKELNNKIFSSVKWASITEIAAKLISPISSMVLARLLSPAEFGVVATVTMVTSLADVFTDAGFQKYLIQKKFNSDRELKESANVAFWTNVSISVFLWLIICIFSDSIATLVGNPGLGSVISFASISLVLTSFSSIQMAIYKKKFDFKTLFFARIIGAFMPVVVTIPLALLGFSYWSIVIGTVATNLSNAIILTVKSDWKPFLFYKFSLLKKMFSFSMWTLVETILLWMTSYIGTFIVGRFLSAYYLGIYKNSISMVTSIMNIIAASTSSVLLSSLSVVKNNNHEFGDILYSFQKSVGLLLIPLGTGVFLYKEFVTNILFGSQWMEASMFVGLYSLAMAFSILTGQYISLTFTAKEKPKLSVISQILYLIISVLLLLFTVQKGFIYLIIATSVARGCFGLINILLGKKYIGLSPTRMLAGMVPSVLGSAAMAIITIALKNISDSIGWTLAMILICICVYVAVELIIPQSRAIIMPIIKNTAAKIKKFTGLRKHNKNEMSK
ncbi:lipopolysaccharide biosynthesis protein [Christensenellaceae bacterium NSJ-63]|uniref:Lipopolysaccharide biosynthesis protein n=1 Tax=Guopingia tenuis TaxID=2763656 RepID=A0A926DHP2_9FIRM|nr:lipopolysaccharide biosynthesis protein [Guopingia tenuis]MBC8538381.1 lipopolysaccharide biosynthesis protein [Guopingia tenuis]